MKTYISLRNLQEMPEELRVQAGALARMYEELAAAEKRIKYMSYMDETKQILEQAKQSLDENIRDLIQMALVLEKVADGYRRTEAKITDYCNLDTVEYPETRFGASGIGNLKEYGQLMPF